MSASPAVRRRSLRIRPALIAPLLWLVALLVLVVIVPLFSPYSPTGQDLAAALQGPSADHLLGTDALGRDTLMRLADGGRVTLTGALLAASVAVVVGSFAGLVAGHFRGGWDAVLTWIADILMSIPVLVILLSVAAVTARSMPVLMIVLGILFSAGVYRIVRAATFNIRGELFVTAGRTSGLSDAQLIGRHELPRLASLILVQATIVSSLALVTQIGLGFLGLDTAAPAPSWGNMIKDAAGTISTTIWPLIPPSAVIAITVLSISAIGDVLERSVGGGRSHGGLPRAHRRHGALIARPAVAAGAAARDGAAILSVRGLTVAIDRDGGAVPLVSDVNLEVHAGEIVGLVGESGAGKSVTARTTLGILPRGAVASGSILVGGTEVIGASERVLQSLRGTRIAYISQEPMASLSPSFRIGNQLAELVRAHTRVSRRAARERALELLRAVQIPDPAVVARLYPHQVSGGMAQRVMIAIALSGDPDVLVADEPTTALDVSVQMQILDLIRRLQEERDLAVLLVTHDWGVVADVCDRAVAMYAGEIVEEAPVADIFARPLHPYSIALRASDPHLQDRGERLATIPGAVPPPGAWPHGCRFAARCAYATDACRAAPIPLLSEAGSRAVRCIRVDTVVEDVRG